MPVRGFTLIELLVVLFIVGMLTAVVFPSMERMARTSQLKTERDAILGRLGELGYEAYLSGKIDHAVEQRIRCSCRLSN